jgi:hypothetical protein
LREKVIRAAHGEKYGVSHANRTRLTWQYQMANGRAQFNGKFCSLAEFYHDIIRMEPTDSVSNKSDNLAADKVDCGFREFGQQLVNLFYGQTARVGGKFRSKSFRSGRDDAARIGAHLNQALIELLGVAYEPCGCAKLDGRERQ